MRVRDAVSTTRRPLSVLAIMTICAGMLVARLAYWSVIEHGRLAAVAVAQQTNLNVQPPARGQIFDSLGNPLATDITASSVYAAPKEIKNPAWTARLLAPALGQSEVQLETMLREGAPIVVLARNVSTSATQKIQNLALPGIILDPKVKREYPEGAVAAHLLGFVGGDNHGYWGLEGYYDKLLSGQAGLRSVLRDTAGNDIHLAAASTAPTRNGADLYLSVNGVVQGLVEDELNKAVKQHSADGGTIVVMDPRTGYILGMANSPSFNPNQYAKANAASYSNAAIQQVYEPGSTFKIVTMAAGLDTHVITPQSALDDTGAFPVGNVVLHNWNMSGFGIENMTQVLQHSANVGAAWVANRLGTNQFYKYLQRFRIGRPTGIDLQGEGSGLLPLPGSKSWTIVNLYTNAFGQGLAVTPIQMINAVATVANSGVMMKPQTVKRMVYDGRIISHPPVREGRVISAQTAHTLTNMLVHSAIGGEASLGLVKGYNIAAKTGTANIAGDNGYLQNDTIASIVGYAPAFHPRFVILVIIRHPRDTPWGSMAAAPVLHDLMQELFMYYHIPPAAHPIAQ